MATAHFGLSIRTIDTTKLQEAHDAESSPIIDLGLIRLGCRHDH